MGKELIEHIIEKRFAFAKKLFLGYKRANPHHASGYPWMVDQHARRSYHFKINKMLIDPCDMIIASERFFHLFKERMVFYHKYIEIKNLFDQGKYKEAFPLFESDITEFIEFNREHEPIEVYETALLEFKKLAND